MTTDQLIHRCAEYLREAGVDTPEHDVKLIMADVLGCSPSDVESAAIMRTDVRALCAKYGRDDDAELVHTFKHMVCRRHAREPLQYIVGHAPFRYLDLKVGPGVFIPRQETELIAQDAIEWVTRHGIYSPRIVDLCAGSGALGLALATEIPGAQVWGVELSPQAAVWTRRNITQISRTYPDITANYHLEIADATCPITLAHLDGTVDVVVSNPPYVPQSQVPQQPEVRDFDPSLALYGDRLMACSFPSRSFGVPMRCFARVACSSWSTTSRSPTAQWPSRAPADSVTPARGPISLTGRAIWWRPSRRHPFP